MVGAGGGFVQRGHRERQLRRGFDKCMNEKSGEAKSHN